MESGVNFSSKTEIIEISNVDITSADEHRSYASNQWILFKQFINKRIRELRKLRFAILNFVFGAYFAWATFHIVELKKNHRYEKNTDDQIQKCKGYCGMQWCDGYGFLLIVTIIVYSGLIINQIGKQEATQSFLRKLRDRSKEIPRKYVMNSVYVICPVICVIYLYFDTMDSRDRLRSLMGIFILFGIGYNFSKDNSKIRWRPVICGFVLQILLGLFCIRLEIGRNIFSCLGQKATTFLNYSKFGSKFVYGELLVKTEIVLAFAILSVIYFTSFIISILYYWGVMQWLVQNLGAPLRLVLGTTVCESVAASSNIFFGLSDTMLLIRPFVKYLTASELHAIMTSCFATVAGDVLAAYIRFGAEASHLITSSVMAAPATLCIAKLFYPETEKSLTTAKNCQMEKSTDSSVLEAASNGASTATNIILSIIANLIAFVSFIAFANGITNWVGYLIGFDSLSFEVFFAKLFMPLSYIIGIPWEDCEKIGKVIATKTIVNEFVAYQRLGELKSTGQISLRSSAIATFAICGFANPGSLGILIGMVTAICPDKQKMAATVGLRAFVAGSFVNFLNASIAGLLMPASVYEGAQGYNATVSTPLS